MKLIPYRKTTTPRATLYARAWPPSHRASLTVIGNGGSHVSLNLPSLITYRQVFSLPVNQINKTTPMIPQLLFGFFFFPLLFSPSVKIFVLLAPSHAQLMVVFRSLLIGPSSLPIIPGERCNQIMCYVVRLTSPANVQLLFPLVHTSPRLPSRPFFFLTYSVSPLFQTRTFQTTQPFLNHNTIPTLPPPPPTPPNPYHTQPLTSFWFRVFPGGEASWLWIVHSECIRMFRRYEKMAS